jgi:hypothetical protein
MPKVHYMHDKIGPMKDAIERVTLPKGYTIQATTMEWFWKIKKDNKEVGTLDAILSVIILEGKEELEAVTKIAEVLEKALTGKVEIDIIVRTK